MTPSTAGRFVWHELFTPDIDKSKAFYGALLGWRFEDVALAGQPPYARIVTASGAAQAGLCAMPGGKAPAHVMGYVAVEDLGAAVERARQAGGTVLAGPTEAPILGPHAVLRDPTGAVFSIVPEGARWRSSFPASARAAGSFCWDQLSSMQFEVAKGFYQTVLRWGAQRFGRGRDIEAFAQAGQPIAGGILAGNAPTASHWMTYLAVDDLTPVRWRIKELGGKVLLDNLAVPGLGILAIFSDSTGCLAGLLAPGPRSSDA
jgi:uncharacterized protein